MTCGNVPVIDSTCATCVDTECCDDGEACGENADCLAIADCLGYCAANDATCTEQCFEANPEGGNLYAVLFACSSRECTTECKLPAEASCGLSFQDTDCQTCGQQKCCDAMYEAGHSLEFWDNNACTTACPANDNDCFVACIVQYQEGFTVGAVLDNCLLTECNAECAATPGSSTCGRAEFGNATCDACIETSCCEQWKDLGGNADHWMFRLCATACPENDSACIDGCYASHIEGAAMWGAGIGCLGTHCNTECAAVFPDLSPCGALSMTSTATDCNPCVETNCCDELTAMGTEYDWWARMYCNTACDETDEACLLDCIKAYPKGLALDIWAGSCIGTSCATECEIDPAPVCGNAYLGDPAGECAVCVEDNCCAQETACWSNLECVESIVCRDLCEADATCVTGCETSFPSGSTLATAAVTCSDTNCETECAGAAGGASP
jgi:hypothetical protein